jgi:nitrile hydratase beta subunit
MNGAHDLGGMHGFGAVEADGGDAFHDAWERRLFGLRIALSRGRGVPPTMDAERHAVEQLAPDVYLRASYFERWLLAGEQIYVRAGLLTEEELEARRRDLAADPDAPLPSHVEPELAQLALERLRRGVSLRREIDAEPRFAPGDAVRTRTAQTTAHTRVARYVRGRRGVVDRVHGAFPLPELAAAGEERHEYVYEVRFEGEELWGESAEPATSLYTQLWESYLLPA